jgi:hypothetical protein
MKFRIMQFSTSHEIMKFRIMQFSTSSRNHEVPHYAVFYILTLLPQFQVPNIPLGIPFSNTLGIYVLPPCGRPFLAHAKQDTELQF